MVYFYKRNASVGSVCTQDRVPVTLAARTNSLEKDEQVLCDPCFVAGVNIAMSPRTDLMTTVYLICNQPSMVMRSETRKKAKTNHD